MLVWVGIVVLVVAILLILGLARSAKDGDEALYRETGDDRYLQ